MRIIKLSATESTNSYLKQLAAANSLSDFTVVTAREQTKGRGQVETVWESEAGKNLTFSILKKYTGFGSQHHFLISICVSYAVYEVLSRLGVPRLSIKWPNDILSGTSKICGILIENTIAGQEIKTSVIGIGLNVNQQSFLNGSKASSLGLLLDREIHLDTLLDALLDNLKRYLDQIERLDGGDMLKNYEDVLFRNNIPATFQEPNGLPFSGIIRGISRDGKLRVALEEDTLKEYALKEIKLMY